MSSSGVATSPTSESTSRPSLIELQPLHQRAAEERERGDREHREQQELEPGRPGEADQVQAADGEGGDAEENDVEAARGRHLERDQHDAHDQPLPPLHRMGGFYTCGVSSCYVQTCYVLRATQDVRRATTVRWHVQRPRTCRSYARCTFRPAQCTSTPAGRLTRAAEPQ